MDRWCANRRLDRGAVVPVQQCFELGRRWYSGRLHPDWRRRTVEEMEAVFHEVGLTGPFWKLP